MAVRVFVKSDKCPNNIRLTFISAQLMVKKCEVNAQFEELLHSMFYYCQVKLYISLICFKITYAKECKFDNFQLTLESFRGLIKK
jgi:hypothetical protein